MVAAAVSGEPARAAGLSVQVRQVSHHFDTKGAPLHVLDDITFTAEPGSFVALVGPSGCGKSTLLRLLAGLDPPKQGKLGVDGVRIVGPDPSRLLVFQDPTLFPWRTVARNIAFVLPRSMDKAERQQRTQEVLDAVGLTGSADKYPWQLSGGMQQRVAIARALAYRPKILLMDEPFASVDAQTRAELEDLMLKVRDQFGMTILFVTHDIDESVYLADQVVVLSTSPATIVAKLDIDLPRPRDQVATREDPAFVSLRSDIARMIRDQSQMKKK